jgi:hypothetical protein
LFDSFFHQQFIAKKNENCTEEFADLSLIVSPFPSGPGPGSHSGEITSEIFAAPVKLYDFESGIPHADNILVFGMLDEIGESHTHQGDK